jgi:AcrR family transcriptional regulator
MADEKIRKRGRPRDEGAREAVLAAAGKLLEEGGLGAVTIEAIAAKAGVSKPTIYRSWRNSYAVAMEAFLESAGSRVPFRNSASAVADLRAQLRKVAEVFATRTGRSVAAMIAVAQSETEIAKAFRNHFILASREEGRQLLERAVAQRELREDIDFDTTLDLLYAPIYFRLLIGHGRLTAEFTDSVLEHALFGIADAPRKKKT